MAKTAKAGSGSGSKSLCDFFSLRSSVGYRRGGRSRSFGDLSAADVHALIGTISKHPGEVDDLVKFVKGHSRIARELTVEDVQAAMDGLTVKEVMGS